MTAPWTDVDLHALRVYPLQLPNLVNKFYARICILWQGWLWSLYEYNGVRKPNTSLIHFSGVVNFMIDNAESCEGFLFGHAKVLSINVEKNSRLKFPPNWIKKLPTHFRSARARLLFNDGEKENRSESRNNVSAKKNWSLSQLSA